MNIQKQSYTNLLPPGIRSSTLNDFELLLRHDTILTTYGERIQYRRIISYTTPAIIEELMGNILIDIFPHAPHDAYLMGSSITGYIFHQQDETINGVRYPILIVRTASLNTYTQWATFGFIDDIFGEINE